MKSLMVALIVALSPVYGGESAPQQAHDQLLTGQSSYHWPFSKPLKYAMEREGRETILLFSYGSLMNRESASMTLSTNALETRRPVVAFGLKRLFNYDPKETSFGPPVDPDDRAMLNVKPTNRASDQVNGVVVELPVDDVLALCKRELGYDLVPVVVADWNDPNPTYEVAYTLVASDRPRYGHQYTNSAINPRPEYNSLVQEGAAEYGDEFLQMWLETTYYADGERTVDEA